MPEDRARLVSGPYSQAIADGRCPVCLGTGTLGAHLICLHDPPLCASGMPCDFCGSTGRWPPPEEVSAPPPPAEPAVVIREPPPPEASPGAEVIDL